ncbi:class I SAM-dependent methyltransferase [Actinomadura rugatobispora]|uniref:Class I SAM-dependent methyltransferase n=1 Tax=Actinomadura rugatobispora TaxID=1994 RepID=A0ABW1AHJ6_9ACTN|nr:class I SAM-dependent methyltransferase [Actinomadura rugatobispora]
MAATASDPAAGGYWNHNTHYHGLVLRAVPRGCRDALDAGCGDGLLVRRLAARSGQVTGLDRSAGMVAAAREASGHLANVGFVEADLLSHDLPREGYDFVCSVATVHHMDFGAALTRMRELLRPRGTLVVIGLARTGSAGDLLYSLAGVPVHHYHRLRHRRRAGEPGAPLAEPGMTWGQVRQESQRLLPGARFQRHALWRYSVTWRKPPGEDPAA